MFKKIISVLSLISITLPTCQVFASSNDLISINDKVLYGQAIPNLEEDGASLQYSKEELSDKLIDSEVDIESFNISSDYKVTIEGTLHYTNSSKDFLLTGEVQNSLEDNKERLILKLTDSLDNFEVINFSLYKDSQNLALFNSELNKDSNKNIFNIYLLDKETNNFNIFESKFDDSIEINSLFENKSTLNVADMEDIMWLGKVFDLVKTTFTQNPQPRAASTQSETSYTYTSNYAFLGYNYKDVLTLKLQLTYPNSISNKGEGAGRAKIVVYSNTSKNLTTGASDTSAIYIGKTKSPSITVATNKDVAFLSAWTYLQANSSAAVSAGLNWGYSQSLAAGLSFSIGYNPQSIVVSNNQARSFNNYTSTNEYVRTYKHSLTGSKYLTKAGDYFESNFTIKDFSATKNSFTIDSQFVIPFYNYTNQKAESLTFGRTSALINQN